MIMKKNMGLLDRRIRVALAVIVVFLFFTEFITGLLALVLIGIAAILLLTSSISFCPIYFPFKFSTRKKLKD
jgi:hypothetical protein